MKLTTLVLKQKGYCTWFQHCSEQTLWTQAVISNHLQWQKPQMCPDSNKGMTRHPSQQWS